MYLAFPLYIDKARVEWVVTDPTTAKPYGTAGPGRENFREILHAYPLHQSI
jgi:hypothetical protein